MRRSAQALQQSATITFSQAIDFGLERCELGLELFHVTVGGLLCVCLWFTPERPLASSNIAMLRLAKSANMLLPNMRAALWLRWNASIAASRYCGTKFCIEFP